MRDYLSSLPSTLLAHAFSFVGHSAQRIGSFGVLNRAVHGSVRDDSVWRQLCKNHWYATDERLQNWPSLTPCNVYKFLEMWAPLEGFYVLTPAFPWGLLVLIRITEGRVMADVIRFIPGESGFDEVSVPLFKVSVTEDGPSVIRSLVEPGWEAGEELGGADLEISGLEPSELMCRTIVGARYFDQTRIVQAGYFTTRHALRLSAPRPPPVVSEEGDMDSDEDIEGVDLEGRRMSVLESQSSTVWEPGRFPDSCETSRHQTETMIREMMSKPDMTCDLALVRSPTDFVPLDQHFPGIRSGLYVGDYGHQIYGQFRTEVLLIEYVTLTPLDLQQELVQPTRIFGRPEGMSNPLPEGLERLAGLETDITFVRGVKQCGDFHVPMGASTFVAVCGPPQACSLLDGNSQVPNFIGNRQTKMQERVIRSWHGFGTLAQPGFHNPSWAAGCLVQLPDDAVDGNHRFGFTWHRDQDAVVLRWVHAQDASPFLQRAWLPSDLR